MSDYGEGDVSPGGGARSGISFNKAPGNSTVVNWDIFITGIVISGLSLLGVAFAAAEYFGVRLWRGRRKPQDVELSPLDAETVWRMKLTGLYSRNLGPKGCSMKSWHRFRTLLWFGAFLLEH